MKPQIKEIKTCQYLLFESADANNVSAAITGMHPVFITYDDQHGGGGKRKRLIYPVAYGVSRAGNPVVRAFQPQGSTKRGVPHWKLFRLDRVKSWRTLSQRTFDPDKLIGLNRGDDKQMETLYAILPIGDATNIKIDKEPLTLKATPITKSDVDNSGNDDVQKKAQQNAVGKEMVSAKDIVNNIVSRISKGVKNISNGAKNLWNRIRGKNQSQNINNVSIDNGEEKSYNNDEWQKYKINAQDENPIYKSEIPGGDNNVSNSETQQPQLGNNSEIEPKNNISDEPITKNDIDNSSDNTNDEDSEENDADEMAKYQIGEIINLMNRMERLDENNKIYLNLR